MKAPAVVFREYVWETLSQDQDVMSIAAGVHDNVPANPGAVYVTLGDGERIDQSVTCIRQAQHILTLHVWSDKKPKAECEQLSWFVEKALHLIPAHSPVHRITNVTATAGRVRRDKDGITNHGVITVQAIIQEQANGDD